VELVQLRISDLVDYRNAILALLRSHMRSNAIYARGDQLREGAAHRKLPTEGAVHEVDLCTMKSFVKVMKQTTFDEVKLIRALCIDMALTLHAIF
jgi:hypothetical protein